MADLLSQNNFSGLSIPFNFMQPSDKNFSAMSHGWMPHSMHATNFVAMVGEAIRA